MLVNSLWIFRSLGATSKNSICHDGGPINRIGRRNGSETTIGSRTNRISATLLFDTVKINLWKVRDLCNQIYLLWLSISHRKHRIRMVRESEQKFAFWKRISHGRLDLENIWRTLEHEPNSLKEFERYEWYAFYAMWKPFADLNCRTNKRDVPFVAFQAWLYF